MAHYILHSKNYIHVKEQSKYNYNYYRNIHTNEVILEIYHEYDDCGEYYNMGTQPTFTNKDFRTAVMMGFGEYGKSIDSDAFVEVDSEWCSL